MYGADNAVLDDEQTRAPAALATNSHLYLCPPIALIIPIVGGDPHIPIAILANLVAILDKPLLTEYVRFHPRLNSSPAKNDERHDPVSRISFLDMNAESSLYRCFFCQQLTRLDDCLAVKERTY